MKVTVKIEIENIEKVNSAIDEVVKKAVELRAAVQRLPQWLRSRRPRCWRKGGSC